VPIPRRARGLDGETHLDVGSRKILARKPFAAGEFALQVGKVAADLRQHQAFPNALCDRPRHRAHEERHRRLLDAVEDQLEQQRRHHGAFREVKPVNEADPLGRAGQRRQAARAVAVRQVFDDRPGLGKRHLAVGDHRRFSQRVNSAQVLGRQQRRGVSPVVPDFIGHLQFLQEPQDSLGARVVQVVDGDHWRGYV
jgi:hypothetical protein